MYREDEEELVTEVVHVMLLHCICSGASKTIRATPYKRGYFAG